jgi:hypothetical protein
MFARLVQFAAVTLALVIGGPVHAAPLTYGTYYDETVAINCNSNGCRLNFSQLPADKLLMVQKINCAIQSTQPVAQTIFQVSATLGGSGLSRNLPIALPASQLVGATYWTNFREDAHFLIGNGRFPYLQLFAQAVANWTVNCTLIGELVTPIQ